MKKAPNEAVKLMLSGEYTDDDLVRVPYKKTGYSIMCQGSQVIHHVTSVESAKEDRMSLIVSLTPANAYHPDKTRLNSMQNLDMNYEKCMPEYEFFRQKSWQMHAVLEDYARNEKFIPDPNHYVRKLRAVSDELNRVANLLYGSVEDKIGFFAEKGKDGCDWLKTA